MQALITLDSQKSALSLLKMASICAEHFDKNCLVKAGLLSLRLIVKPNSVPMIFPHANNERPEMISTHNYPAISLQEQSSEMPALTENNSVILSSLETPSTSRKRIRYPGDISENVLDKMTPKRLKASVRQFRESCKKKDRRIKCLQSQQT
ncbi:uncharacterized protein LOC117611116 [Osmia lignaria lignaria]|uniref:uncharacterized protein LOC117611116 n=1 Tax=Osmia lignaria lignaria TaxID=1437193 RepID=UPI00402B968E